MIRLTGEGNAHTRRNLHFTFVDDEWCPECVDDASGNDLKLRNSSSSSHKMTNSSPGRWQRVSADEGSRNSFTGSDQ